MQQRWKVIARRVFLAGLGYLLIGVVLLLPYGGGACIPTRLQLRNHDDYTVPGTKWVPRKLTSFCLQTSGPKAIWATGGTEFLAVGGVVSPKPIPKPGEGHIAVVQVRKGLPFFLPYMTYTTKFGWHWRLGIRWDDVDGYYVFPSAASHGL